MMIDDVMYGMMPSAKIAICVRAPPENSCSTPSTPPSFALSLKLDSCETSMPGEGM